MIPKIFSDIILLFIGYLYPAFESNRAIKTNTSINYWLRYWIIFGIFKIVEPFSDVIISWLPFYEETKIMLIFTLIKPRMQGSKIVYQQVVKPLLNKYEPDFDKFNSQFSIKQVQSGLTAFYNLGKHVGSFIIKLAKKSHGIDNNLAPPAPSLVPEEESISPTNTPIPTPRDSFSKNVHLIQDFFSNNDSLK